MSTAVALLKGSPLLYPMWIVVIPLFSLFLCFLGQNQISNSEGTRAGGTLCKYGIWISIFTGLGYFAYYQVTGMALVNQATEFLLAEGDTPGFFNHLRKAGEDPTELNAAFLLSLPATQRGSVRPDQHEQIRRQFDTPLPDGNPTYLDRFRDNPLVSACVRFGKDVKVTPVGVLEWRLEKGSYEVYRRMRIETPEAIMDAVLLVQSTEGDQAGQGRKWFLATDKSALQDTKRTPQGEILYAARRLAARSLDNTVLDWNQGKAVPFTKLSTTRWEDINLLEPARSKLKEKIHATLESSGTNRMQIMAIPDEIGGWVRQLPDGRVEVKSAFKLGLPSEPGSSTRIMCEGIITVESQKKLDLTRIPSQGDTDWDVATMQIRRAMPMQPKGPG